MIIGERPGSFLNRLFDQGIDLIAFKEGSNCSDKNGRNGRKFPEGILSVSQQHPSHEQETPHGLQVQHSQGMVFLQWDIC